MKKKINKFPSLSIVQWRRWHWKSGESTGAKSPGRFLFKNPLLLIFYKVKKKQKINLFA